MIEVVAAVLERADGSFLLAQRPPGKVYAGWWEFPGGKVDAGEPLARALERELDEELGIAADIPVEGPVAICESIDPQRPVRKHVVHIMFAGDLTGRPLDAVRSRDAAVRGHRLFSPDDLDSVVVHPPIQRFLRRWRPGDPVAYLGSLWVP